MCWLTFTLLKGQKKEGCAAAECITHTVVYGQAGWMTEALLFSTAKASASHEAGDAGQGQQTRQPEDASRGDIAVLASIRSSVQRRIELEITSVFASLLF